MQFAIKQRLVSFGDDFDIRNAQGKKQYFVDGKAFAFTTHLDIKDMSRNVVLSIKKKLFTFFPAFTIAKKGRVLATIRKRPFTLRTRFAIDIPGGNTYEVVGNLFRYDYVLNKNGKQVAKVSKKILAFSDSYGIDISEEENHELILAIAIVIDIVLHKGK